jgi:hypothetical protein
MSPRAVEIYDMSQDVHPSLLKGTAFLVCTGDRRHLPYKRAFASAHAMGCASVGEGGPGNLNFDEVGNIRSRIPRCCLWEGPKEGRETVGAAEVEPPYFLDHSMADPLYVVYIRFGAQILLQGWICQMLRWWAQGAYKYWLFPEKQAAQQSLGKKHSVHWAQVDRDAMQVADEQSPAVPGCGIAPLYGTRLVFLPPQLFDHHHVPRVQGR